MGPQGNEELAPPTHGPGEGNGYREAGALAQSRGGGGIAIEARGLEKTFRIPMQRVTTFKERAVRPFSSSEGRVLQAVRGISFDVGQGEFFGIVGRNGSGKSTLLKILASIYRADAGKVRMAGRVAPFIELGVGFNLEFPARENVVLNGVMMGLTQKEARRRLDAVIDFAELDEFVDLKLKNYSSGMMVRLAFSAMIQADADIMLIDEVLAVGDASFQQKCLDVFHELRDSHKTVVLVTHDMTTVEEFCDRAMLIHDGEMRHIGDPEEVARRYFRLNFGGITDDKQRLDMEKVGGGAARFTDIWLTDGAGERVKTVEQRQPIRIRATIEAAEDIQSPGVGFVLTNVDDVVMHGFGSPINVISAEVGGILEAGERVSVSATIENPLAPGRYYLTCIVGRNGSMADVVQRLPKALDFVVYGHSPSGGVVSLETSIETVSGEEAES